MTFDSKEEARKIENALGGAEASLPNRQKYEQERRDAISQLRRDVRSKAIEQFGVVNPKHPDCSYCVQVSVFGGPGHEPGYTCRSGRNPHCTCDSCF